MRHYRLMPIRRGAFDYYVITPEIRHATIAVIYLNTRMPRHIVTPTFNHRLTAFTIDTDWSRHLNGPFTGALS